MIQTVWLIGKSGEISIGVAFLKVLVIRRQCGDIIVIGVRHIERQLIHLCSDRLTLGHTEHGVRFELVDRLLVRHRDVRLDTLLIVVSWLAQLERRTRRIGRIESIHRARWLSVECPNTAWLHRPMTTGVLSRIQCTTLDWDARCALIIESGESGNWW